MAALSGRSRRWAIPTIDPLTAPTMAATRRRSQEGRVHRADARAARHGQTRALCAAAAPNAYRFSRHPYSIGHSSALDARESDVAFRDRAAQVLDSGQPLVPIRFEPPAATRQRRNDCRAAPHRGLQSRRSPAARHDRALTRSRAAMGATDERAVTLGAARACWCCQGRWLACRDWALRGVARLLFEGA